MSYKGDPAKLIKKIWPIFIDDDGYFECSTCWYKNKKIHWTKAGGHYPKPKNSRGLVDRRLGYFIAKYGHLNENIL